MTAKLVQRTPGLLGRNMTERMNRLLADERDARVAAAKTATQVTQSSFHYKRVADAPPRAGRRSTGGQFTSHLNWVVTGDDVAFDQASADAQVPYWIIQEIGTGKSATLKQGGRKNPRGRPRAGATYVKTVRSQRGRLIPSSLVFATSAGGQYSPPGAGGGQQLYLRSMIKGAPVRRRAMVITREIEGQHFVQKGGQAGFRQYKPTVLAAARRAFQGRGFKP